MPEQSLHYWWCFWRTIIAVNIRIIRVAATLRGGSIANNAGGVTASEEHHVDMAVGVPTTRTIYYI